MVSKQRSYAKLDVELNHQEDEGDAKEVRDVGGEAHNASANGEQYENCVEDKVRDEAPRFELKIKIY